MREKKKYPGLAVSTPLGKISAKVIPDDEYLGIALLLDNNKGQPGAILEYDPNENAVLLRVYGKNNPDGDPIEIYRIS